MIRIAPGNPIQIMGSVGNRAGTSEESRKIAGPWEPRDLCIKHFDGQGQVVGLVSYILPYTDNDKPLAAVDAMLQTEGWTLFEDATPTEQAVYVQQRMKVADNNPKS